jgi:autotransporter translocation and assembly factor TamB
MPISVLLQRKLSENRAKRLIWINGKIGRRSKLSSGKTVIEEGSAMPSKIDELLPSAKDIQKQAALKEAEKAGENSPRREAAEAEKRALIEKLSKPSGLSEEEKVKLWFDASLKLLML